MSSIQQQPLAAGSYQNCPSNCEPKIGAYVKKQSITASQSLSAGLTIQTKDGDLVTLNSASYFGYDALMYDSEGKIESPNANFLVKQSHSEVTLSSGESFSFMVVGDLSEQELADIEDIIKGIDEIIAEMAQGDMEEAVELAMGMGSYDTVSMYAADISYERNFQATAEIAAAEKIVKPEPVPEILPSEESEIPVDIKPFPENHAPRKRRKNSIQNISGYVEKMMEKLEKHEDKQIARSKKAVDKLFDHHMKRGRRNERAQENTAFNYLEKVQKQVDKFIDKIANKIFDRQLDMFS